MNGVGLNYQDGLAELFVDQAYIVIERMFRTFRKSVILVNWHVTCGTRGGGVTSHYQPITAISSHLKPFHPCLAISNNFQAFLAMIAICSHHQPSRSFTANLSHCSHVEFFFSHFQVSQAIFKPSRCFQPFKDFPAIPTMSTMSSHFQLFPAMSSHSSHF